MKNRHRANSSLLLWVWGWEWEVDICNLSAAALIGDIDVSAFVIICVLTFKKKMYVVYVKNSKVRMYPAPFIMGCWSILSMTSWPPLNENPPTN